MVGCDRCQRDAAAYILLHMVPDPFAPVWQSVAPLAALPCPWFVAGGWAIDLYLGRVTRAHGDVDVAIYRQDQSAVHAFLTTDGWDVSRVVDGCLIPWMPNERLALPVHEVHATARDGDRRLELLLNEGDGAMWRFRKAPAVVRARSVAERRTPDGLPYFAPELPLLYKALGATRRATDDDDFAAVLPALSGEARTWLADSLRGLAPQHSWLAALEV